MCATQDSDRNLMPGTVLYVSVVRKQGLTHFLGLGLLSVTAVCHIDDNPQPARSPYRRSVPSALSTGSQPRYGARAKRYSYVAIGAGSMFTVWYLIKTHTM